MERERVCVCVWVKKREREKFKKDLETHRESKTIDNGLNREV